ncbi:MAG: saccharopine dehydrogenase NADP-binding domain-containing protein [Acidobacteriota bacterium]
MARGDRDLDLIVWGATGFVGRLVCEYLLKRYGVGDDLAWALGGRSRTRLESLRDELGSGATKLPIIQGDALEETSMLDLAGRAQTICSTVGPYAEYGSNLVSACARLGTDYCDLTGEVHWIRRMIDSHQDAAASSGARIVHCCGFDSIPSDLGVLFLQQQMRARHGVPCSHIRTRVGRIRGGLSGGTVASLLNVLDEARSDPEMRHILANPYALNPQGQQQGPDGPDQTGARWDEVFQEWTGPFVMSGINTRVARRSNALLGHTYGRDFRYDEAVLIGPGLEGKLKAMAFSAALGTALAAASMRPLRTVLAMALPAPGEGPSREKQETGFFELRLHGTHPTDSTLNLRCRVTGDRDPGYGSTAKMLGESAVCLARDAIPGAGGFWTPASILGDRLLERLPRNAGVRFEIEG